jgi:hypothetical protein
VSSLIATLAEQGVRAYCYFTVDGWGPRTNALLPLSSGGVSAWDAPQDRVFVDEQTVQIEPGGGVDIIPKTVHQNPHPGYKFATEWPDFSAEEPSAGKLAFGSEIWVPSLIDPVSSVSESWDLRANTVSLGQMNLKLIDPASPMKWLGANNPGRTPEQSRAEHGWTPDSLLTDLLASRKRVVGELKLGMSVGPTQSAFALVDSPVMASLEYGQTWWLGREAVIYVGDPMKALGIVGNRGVGPWIRGVFGTEAQEHFTFELGGDGFLCDHPTYFRNRGLRVYMGVYGPGSGNPQLRRELGIAMIRPGERDRWYTRGVIDPSSPSTEPRYGVDGAIAGYETLIWRGELSDWSQAEPEGFSFTAKAMTGRLDRLMGFQQFVAKTRGPGRNHEPASIVQAIANQRELSAWAEIIETPRVVQAQNGGGVAGGFVREDVEGGFHRDVWNGHMRIGGMVCAASHSGLAFEDDGVTPLRPIVQGQHYFIGGGDGVRSGWGILGTVEEFKGREQDEAGLEFNEVLLTHPLAYGKKWFSLEGRATCQPVQLALMLMLSEGDYAVLPPQWQGGMKEADIDIRSWTETLGNSQGFFVPGLVIGFEGKTEVLRSFLEREILGPCGIVMVTNKEGKIAARQVSDAYPGVVYPTFTEADILDPPGASQAGNQSAMLGGVTFKFDYDWSGQRAEEWQEHTALSGDALERHDLMGGVTTFESKGLMQDDTFGLGPLAMSMAMRLSRMFSEPMPIVSVATGMDKLDIAVADIIHLTVSTLSHPLTGQRGYVKQPCLVVSRALDLASARMNFELLPVEERNTCLWAPSAAVSQRDAQLTAGVGPVIYVDKNTYSDGAEYSTIPLVDADAFGEVKAGTDPVYVALRTRKGMWLTDKPHLVVAAGVNNRNRSYIKIEGRLIGDGAEVVRKYGDVIEFVHYGPGDGNEDDPTHPWSTYMKQHAAQADTANLDIGSTDDEPKEYGL